MRTAPPREKAVRAAGVACDEHGGQRLVLVGRKRGVRAAPRQKTEEQVVVLPVGKVDRFPSLDRRRLPRQLARIFTFLDHDSSFESGADVVATTVTKRGQQLFGRKKLEDASVSGLRRCGSAEAHFLQGIAKIFRRLGLDDDFRHPRSTRPFDKGIDGLRRSGQGAPRHVHLARRADPADLHAGHRSP